MNGKRFDSLGLHINRYMQLDGVKVERMLRLVEEAKNVRGKLWDQIIAGVSPQMQEVFFTWHGMDILITSLGDMLRPGSNQLFISVESQLDGLEADINKVKAMLLASEVLGKSGRSGWAVNSRVPAAVAKQSERKGRARR